MKKWQKILVTALVITAIVAMFAMTAEASWYRFR